MKEIKHGSEASEHYECGVRAGPPPPPPPGTPAYYAVFLCKQF